MFLAGFLVAGGIILAAFTLHGYLDPDWQRKQVDAAKARDVEAARARERAAEAVSASAFQPKERLAVGRAEPEPKPPAVKPPAKPDPAADAKPAPKPAAPKKKAADNKPADRPPPPQPQQASFSWQKLFGGN
jgi:hypothetical protein